MWSELEENEAEIVPFKHLSVDLFFFFLIFFFSVIMQDMGSQCYHVQY